MSARGNVDRVTGNSVVLFVQRFCFFGSCRFAYVDTIVGPLATVLRTVPISYLNDDVIWRRGTSPRRALDLLLEIEVCLKKKKKRNRCLLADRIESAVARATLKDRIRKCPHDCMIVLLSSRCLAMSIVRLCQRWYYVYYYDVYCYNKYYISTFYKKNRTPPLLLKINCYLYRRVRNYCNSAYIVNINCQSNQSINVNLKYYYHTKVYQNISRSENRQQYIFLFLLYILDKII